MRELGAEGPSFPPIVAAGPNGALPACRAGRARDRGRRAGHDRLRRDRRRLLLRLHPHLRDGGVGRGGRRGLRAGPRRPAGRPRRGPGRRRRQGGRRGRPRGHRRRPGTASTSATGSATGSGSTCTRPRGSRQRSEEDLLAGDVVIVEPGVYVPGAFGVRIEDLVVVEEDGARNLCTRPKELLVTG